MTKEIKFPYKYLQACLPHSANRDVRFYLCGVYLGDGFMAATDGHRLIMIEDECFNGCNYIIDRSVVDFFIKKVGKNPMTKEATLTIMENGFNTLELMGVYEYFKFMDGKFPDVKKVDIEKPEKSEGQPSLNPKYLLDFVKSAKFLTGINSIQSTTMIYTGETTPVYVCLSENAHGILMPLRV